MSCDCVWEQGDYCSSCWDDQRRASAIAKGNHRSNDPAIVVTALVTQLEDVSTLATALRGKLRDELLFLAWKEGYEVGHQNTVEEGFCPHPDGQRERFDEWAAKNLPQEDV